MKTFLRLWHVSFFFFWGGVFFLPLYVTYLHNQKSINHFQFATLLLIFLAFIIGLILWPISNIIIFWQSHKKRKQKTLKEIFKILLNLDPHYLQKVSLFLIVLAIAALGRDILVAPQNILKWTIPIAGCILLLMYSLFRPVILMLNFEKGE
jgi:hypothetical protein